jgi:hypothetical protein
MLMVREYSWGYVIWDEAFGKNGIKQELLSAWCGIAVWANRMDKTVLTFMEKDKVETAW